MRSVVYLAVLIETIVRLWSVVYIAVLVVTVVRLRSVVYLAVLVVTVVRLMVGSLFCCSCYDYSEFCCDYSEVMVGCLSCCSCCDYSVRSMVISVFL